MHRGFVFFLGFVFGILLVLVLLWRFPQVFPRFHGDRIVNSGAGISVSGDQKCAHNRWIIKKASTEFFKKEKQKSPPSLFDLIGKGYLKEIPNCPSNGEFTIQKHKDQIEVSCSIHGKTTVNR